MRVLHSFCCTILFSEVISIIQAVQPAYGTCSATDIFAGTSGTPFPDSKRFEALITGGQFGLELCGFVVQTLQITNPMKQYQRLRSFQTKTYQQVGCSLSKSAPNIFAEMQNNNSSSNQHPTYKNISKLICNFYSSTSSTWKQVDHPCWHKCHLLISGFSKKNDPLRTFFPNRIAAFLLEDKGRSCLPQRWIQLATSLKLTACHWKMMVGTHRIHGTGIFTYMKSIQINEM